MTYALSDGEYYVQTIKADSTNKVNGTGCMKFNGFEWLIKDVWSGSQFFTSSGTFIVPAGITSILVTASAGGGGGGAANNSDANGSSGTSTVIGTFLTLSGGGGGAGGAGDSTGNTGANGSPYTSLPVAYAGYGVGGGGANFRNYSFGGTGGHGGTCYNTQFYVTPGQKINITIGAGGAGGYSWGNETRGGNGASGFVKIDWGN
jgi:hypothetical protein